MDSNFALIWLMAGIPIRRPLVVRVGAPWGGFTLPLPPPRDTSDVRRQNPRKIPGCSHSSQKTRPQPQAPRRWCYNHYPLILRHSHVVIQFGIVFWFNQHKYILPFCLPEGSTEKRCERSHALPMVHLITLEHIDIKLFREYKVPPTPRVPLITLENKNYIGLYIYIDFKVIYCFLFIICLMCWGLSAPPLTLKNHPWIPQKAPDLICRPYFQMLTV